ncbi:unnamed protein product, partial [Polarella glacialis]
MASRAASSSSSSSPSSRELRGPASPSPRTLQAVASCEAPQTPTPPRTPGQLRRYSHGGALGAGRQRRQTLRAGSLRPPADESQSDDELLALATSSLDISCEVGAECLTGGTSCAAMSVPSSSWSPASEPGVADSARRISKRRSISELSQSARMTPKELENRGLGVPWQRAVGLCTIGMQPGEAADQARQFCLVPTPELGKQASRVVSPPLTPEARSPSAMQRCFVDRVRRASMCITPASEGRRYSAAADSSEMPWSPDPVSPFSCGLNDAMSELGSPIARLHEPSGVRLGDNAGFAHIFSPSPGRHPVATSLARCLGFGGALPAPCVVPAMPQMLHRTHAQ